MTKSRIFVVAIAILGTCRRGSAERLSPQVIDALDEESRGLSDGTLDLASSDLSRRADHPHAHLNVPQLIAYYEYKAETHMIRTSDGYVLEVHRIAGNRTHRQPNGKPVVFLMHGLLCSSMDWIITGPLRGLGFILADAGYDVWMGNARGNRYSRRHTSLQLTDDKYWDFSWHEIGKYDLAATIDYVLRRTGREKLAYVGHSQGSTTITVMLSELPDYNEKISVISSLAPISYCSHMKSPVFRTLARFEPISDAVLVKVLGKRNFDPGNELFRKFAAFLCDDGSATSVICANVIFMICGYSEELLDRELLPTILAHVPAGASIKQFTHFSQLVSSGQFRQFDYGWLGNYRKYSRHTPPPYKLENVRIPVALHYAVNDWLSDPLDVEKIHSRLPNPIGKFRVPHEKFNHLDFLWGKNARTLVYDKILSLLAKYHR